jgi:hypothetical protein
MSNNIITPTEITTETLRILHNTSAFLGNIDTQHDADFGKKGEKVGSTINIRRPVQWTVRSGAVANIQDVNETTTPLTIQPEFGIDWAFADFDLSLSIDKFSERYLKTAGTRLAAELDRRIAALYVQVANFSGTPGTVPATAQVMLDSAVLLDNCAAPRDDDRRAAILPLTNSKLVGGMSGLFNNQSTQSAQIKKGLMQTNLGMDFQMSQNLPTHTVGPLGGAPAVNGANQGLINAGTTDNPYAATTALITNAWTAAAAVRLNAGDVFTIAGVFAVNLETKQALPNLQQFVVTAQASSDGAGNLTAVISPAIIAGGAYQNVTARPANGALLTVQTGTAGTGYGQNMLYHKSAITLATVPMEVPKGMDMADQVVYENVSLRFVRGYDITNNRRICRFDILAGMTIQRPEWVVRITQ